jgi:ribosome-binding protein aMBF1 (putative translation factor)
MVKAVVTGPLGIRARAAAGQRAARSADYRAERLRLAFWVDLAAQVILFRTRQRLSQAELAKRVGTSYSAISRLESGQHAANGETLRRVAEALGLRLVLVDEETAKTGA